MLITFKSDADGDVIMFGAVGQTMLEALGKDPEDLRGIVTVEQLPDAILRLRAAIVHDKSAQAPELEDEAAEEARRDAGLPRPDPIVHFSQRAAPLLSMLEHAERAGVAVLWET